MPPHAFTNTEMQIYYENGRKFNGVYSRNDLSNTVWVIYNKS